MLGGHKDVERANTPDEYIPTIAMTRPMAVYLDAGEKDNDSRLASTSLYDKFKARGVDVTLNDPREAMMTLIGSRPARSACSRTRAIM